MNMFAVCLIHQNHIIIAPDLKAQFEEEQQAEEQEREAEEKELAKVIEAAKCDCQSHRQIQHVPKLAQECLQSLSPLVHLLSILLLLLVLSSAPQAHQIQHPATNLYYHSTYPYPYYSYPS